MVTDMSGNVVQQVLYAPFGEVITEYNAYWHQGKIPDYMFNAKEKDEESGMYYYEARYYNPPSFISRDPLFEKKPWIGPYTYCRNNPLIFIDPNGEDEYEFDKKGKLVNIIVNDKADILRIVKTDRNGNIKTDKQGNTKTVATSQNFEPGSIACAGNEVLGRGKGAFNATVVEMSEKGESNRVQMFEFLAENTQSEWGTFTGTNASGGYLGVLSTSYSNGEEASSSFLVENYIFNGAKVSEWYHSHPKRSIETPSGYSHAPWIKPSYGRGDHGIATYYNQHIPNLKVYAAGSGSYYTFKKGSYSKDKR
jgi:RHS repeat-associated protein